MVPKLFRLQRFRYFNWNFARRFCQFAKNDSNNRSSAIDQPDSDISNSKTRLEFLNMLDHFRRRRLYENELYLRKATYFCWKTGLENEFVSLVDEWFRQAKLQIFDRRPFFKATSDLCNLGKLNRSSRGLLMEKLCWPPIEYFMNRVARIGFDRFHAEDIAGAVYGLQNLVQIRSIDNQSITEIDRRRLSPEFVNGLKKYLIAKRPIDGDWKFLIRITAPQLLNLFCHVEFDRSPPIDLLRPLCRLSKLGFDLLSTKGDDESEEDDGQRLRWYSHAWLRWKIDPNTIEKESWSSWFKASAIILNSSRNDESIRRQILPRYLSDMISVADIFDQRRNFWPIIDSWHRCVVRMCDEASDLRNEFGSDSIDRQMANLVYSCGQLARKLAKDNSKMDACRNLFSILLPRFEKALIARPFEDLDASSHCRWLTGIRDIRKDLNLFDFELSIGYYRFLADWCKYLVSSRTEATANSKAAALSLYLLREMAFKQPPPTFALRALVNLFSIGLSETAIEEQSMSTFNYFATSCSTFRIDIEDKDFWKKYFAKIESVLTDSWDQEKKIDNRGYECCLFLSSVCQIVDTYRLFEEWKSIKNIYEKRTTEMLACFKPKQAFFLAKAMSYAKNRYEIEFDSKVIEKLVTISSSYARK